MGVLIVRARGLALVYSFSKHVWRVACKSKAKSGIVSKFIPAPHVANLSHNGEEA